MRHIKQFRSAITLGFILLAALSSSHAGVLFTNIFTFNGTNGVMPGILVPAGNNKFYGITEFGGPNFVDWNNTDVGGIFSITYDGVFSNLCFFEGTNGSDGAYLTPGTDGSFYGTTGGGLNGTIFKLNPDGTMANPNLAPNLGAANGYYPFGMVQDRDGTIYGTTMGIPVRPQVYNGTIYKIDTNGVFSTLVSFNGTNGYNPVCLLLGADDCFYGVAESGGNGFDISLGPAGDGTIFRVDRNGNLTNIFFFNDSDPTPVMLVQGADDDLYGTTSYGGINGAGAIFRITTNGALVWSFPLNGTNGYGPYWLTTANDGNIYGITSVGGSSYTGSQAYGGYGFGTIFRMTPSGSFTTLVEFDGTNDVQPATIIQGADGNLYGTAENDATWGYGVVFKLSIPMQPSFTAITQSNGLISLKWTSVSGQMYQLQTNSSLCSTDWGNLGAPILATNGFMCASDTVAPNASLFYRVTVLP
jgi:uncharacterized repeat protein (TIGR03803 family)